MDEITALEDGSTREMKGQRKVFPVFEATATKKKKNSLRG